MHELLATMVTMTTYGTWLRGDRRGWVEDGVVKLPDSELERLDLRRMKHPVFRFAEEDLIRIGQRIGESIIRRKAQRIVALTVQNWHIHIVVGRSPVAITDVVKCAKDAVRYALRPGRPIWTAGFDKRHCFDMECVRNHVDYVERHNVANGWPAKPWPFLEPFD